MIKEILDLKEEDLKDYKYKLLKNALIDCLTEMLDAVKNDDIDKLITHKDEDLPFDGGPSIIYKGLECMTLEEALFSFGKLIPKSEHRREYDWKTDYTTGFEGASIEDMTLVDTETGIEFTYAGKCK